jgi:hypothetical protein
VTSAAELLSRTKKILLDAGEVASLADLDRAFEKYAVKARFDAGVVDGGSHEIALLTVLNLAVRTLDGQVEIQGPADAVLSVRGFEGKTVEQAADEFGARKGYRAVIDAPTIDLTPSHSGISLVAAGWRACAYGIGCAPPFPWASAEPLAVTAAAALAVNEAFHLLRRDHPLGGRRVVGLSLWRPEVISGWQSPALDGPVCPRIGHPLHLLGLGHLGQAYLWALSFQIEEPGESVLWLQDDDRVTGSSWSTSMLTARDAVGATKARMAARAMETRGFSTRVVEQRLYGASQQSPDAPGLVLFGVDNLEARRMISSLKSAVLVEAGLGNTHKSFRGIRVHSFPSKQDSAKIWTASQEKPQNLAPAYQALLNETKDACGTAALASRSVGVPFVGCFAASLVVAELIRRLQAEGGFDVQDISLRDLTFRELIPSAD